MNLLVVIPFNALDSAMAESLCDWIYQLSDRKQSGSCLLIAYANVHEEAQVKVKCAAEVAFEHVELSVAPEISSSSKVDRIKHLFRFAADYIIKNYRLSWLWLEPDCVPLKKDWLEQLASAYESQPKRYLGAYMKMADDKFFLARISVYPTDTIKDLAASTPLVSLATKTRLTQEIKYNHGTDLDKIREDAILLHSDKSGQLIKHLREKYGS
jgi:hypothetical protein